MKKLANNDFILSDGKAYVLLDRYKELEKEHKETEIRFKKLQIAAHNLLEKCTDLIVADKMRNSMRIKRKTNSTIGIFIEE